MLVGCCELLLMKVICMGEDECVVGIYVFGFGVDEML